MLFGKKVRYCEFLQSRGLLHFRFYFYFSLTIVLSTLPLSYFLLCLCCLFYFLRSEFVSHCRCRPFSSSPAATLCCTKKQNNKSISYRCCCPSLLQTRKVTMPGWNRLPPPCRTQHSFLHPTLFTSLFYCCAGPATLGEPSY
jgi:hypothetical protein